MRLTSKILSNKGEVGFASSYTYDSGANSIEKQLAGGYKSYIGNGGLESPKKKREEDTKGEMSRDLNDSEKSELIRYRHSLIKRTKEKKREDKRKLRKRLDKYKNPLPMRIMEDIKREKSIRGDDVSPII